MTDFGALIYTDCRPGQGLTGGAGLQFQATSANVDGDAMALVQRHLLYEPPASWMREQRPVEEYPLSFAHIGGPQIATAAGVYLGREANGTREGNQLTHAVITRDPASYGLLRPAQLFGAPFWAVGPAATTRCALVPASPSPGLLDTESVQAFVSRHPDGPRLLAALLTVLSLPDDGQAPQVLFIADQVEPVLTWIAAATLLLPHRQALDVGFKVFTTAPTRSTLRVLAVHPGWDTPPASVERPGGYLVVDLLAGRWSHVEPAPVAHRWAVSFCERDPFDVTDAVELAAGSGLAPAEAVSLARLAVLGEPPEAAHAEDIVEWLSEGPRDLVAAYGAPVAAALATDVDRQPLGLLRKLDRATRGGDFDDQAVVVRLALLGAELRHASHADRASRPDHADRAGRADHAGWGSAGAVPPVTDREWDDAAAGQAQRMVLTSLSAAGGARFAAILGVAGRFGIAIGYVDIGPSADRFIADWARDPAAAYPWKDWPAGAHFMDRLRDHLNDQIATRAVAARAVGEAWSKHLPILDPVGALDAALIGARMVAYDEKDRLDLVTLLVAAAGPKAPRHFTALGHCLWRWTPPTMAELRILADAMPPGAAVDPVAVDRALDDRIRFERLEMADLRLVAEMVADGRLEPTRNIAELLACDEVLRRTCVSLPTLEKADPEIAARLNELREAVVLVHEPALIKALLSTVVPSMVLAVLDVMPLRLQRGYAKAAAAQLKEKPNPSTVALAMTVAVHTRDRPTADELISAVNRWISWAGSGPVDKVSALLDVRGGTPAYDRWRKLLDANKVRRGRSWLRGPKGR